MTPKLSPNGISTTSALILSPRTPTINHGDRKPDHVRFNRSRRRQNTLATTPSGGWSIFAFETWIRWRRSYVPLESQSTLIRRFIQTDDLLICTIPKAIRLSFGSRKGATPNSLLFLKFLHACASQPRRVVWNRMAG